MTCTRAVWSGLQARPDGDLRAGRGILGAVAEQVGKDLLHQHVIHRHQREIRRNIQTRAGGAAIAWRILVTTPVAISPREFHLRCGFERAGLDARHIQDVANQLVEMVGLFFDGRQQVLAGIQIPDRPCRCAGWRRRP